MDKKSRNTIIISIVALAIVLITVTYAYFSARITGIESASTISLTAGRMSIVYTEGNENVTLTNIYPREEAWATKTFTLTGYNTTSLDMKYNIGLNVETNTFTDGYLTYDLTLISSTNGTPIATQTNIPINGTGKIKFGTGTFTNADGDTHNYELKIYFKDNGENQNDAQGAIFNAKIYVEEVKKEPEGWSNPTSGTLLAGIKSNNSRLSTMGTIPGRETSASSPVTLNISDFCGEESDCEVYYYPTQEDALNRSNESSGNYSEVYNQLPGKWIEHRLMGSCYVTEASASSITYTNNSSVLTEEKNLLLSTEDDYGTSYYYRGAVDNNYLVFANMCWRIVRIDGLGNIKLVLYNYNPNNIAQNPCAASEDGETNAFARIYKGSLVLLNSYTSEFNVEGKNAYVGYMYSNNPDSSDFNIAHANDNDSTILTFLKNWYDEKLRSYNDMLADVIWCNDKSIVTDTTYDPLNFGSVQATGLGTDKTYYKATYRLVPTNSAAPSLVCPSAGSDGKLSKFTARDAINGNAKLYSNNKEYKIGLLTADEIAFAGAKIRFGKSDNNFSNYLFKNALEGFWTLSPSDFNNDGDVPEIFCSAGGNISIFASNSGGAVRPAVSLKSDVTISEGNGTSENPFKVIEPEPEPIGPPIDDQR